MSSFFNRIQKGYPQDRSRIVIETENGDHYSWSEFERETAQIASYLISLGLKKGDRVAVQVDKSPHSLFLYLACLRAGLVYLPMNTAYQQEEVEYIVGNAEPAALICRPGNLQQMRDIAYRRGARQVLTLDANGSGSLMTGAATRPSELPPVDCHDADPATIIYTSGTTGRPKGAVLSHRNLEANAADLVRLWGFTDQDVLLHALPLFHVHGLFVACHCALLSGAKMLWHSHFDLGLILRDLPRSTVLMGVPTFYTRLLATPDFGRATCARMRLFISGSAPLLEETFVKFRERSGHAILERYGMTETGMNTSNPLTGERRAGTVGFPLGGVTLRVTGENGTVLPREQTGMIEVKGDNVFRGYWKMAHRTGEDFSPDGFFRTGDLGKIDAEGYVHISGRAKDLIITGGYNVYPREIESLIDQMEGVEESAVIGISHGDFGEAVVAVVKLKRGASAAVSEGAMIAQLKSRIAGYKVPKQVHFVDELPRNTMGKVQKNLLRLRFADTAKS